MRKHHWSPIWLGTATLTFGSALGPYQVILDKGLLGGVDEGVAVVAPTSVPVVVTPGWASEYQMTMITRDLDTGVVRVGLQHKRDGRGFLLVQGEEPLQDLELLGADFERNQATIRYRGSPHLFTLETGTASVPSEPSEGRRGPSRVVVPTPRPRLAPTPEAASVEVETPRFQSQEELDTHLKQVQMDALRTGKPPLPIPLTPEMDEQLVREGVLPPPGTP